MGAKAFSIPYGAMISGIKAALQYKGLITTIFYETSQYLIFSTPLTSKIIKIGIFNDTSPTFYFQYGDAWTSGATITNAVSIGYNTTSVDYQYTGIDMIVDTTYFLLVCKGSGFSTVSYLGALTNGDVIMFSAGTVLADALNTHARNITRSEDMFPISLAIRGNITDDSGNLLAFPLMWAKSGLNILYLNGEMPAETVGVRTATVKSVPVNFGASCYITTSAYLYIANATAFTAPFVCEFTERS